METIIENKILDFAKNVRMDILELAYNSGGSAHLGGGLSMVETLAVLYSSFLKFDVENPAAEDRDIFILSKGHGVLGFYAVLHQVGFISDDELRTFQQNGSHFSSHPVKNILHGIESSNGSLGQGLAFASGIAFAKKMKNKNAKVFTIVGNGELNEGSNWESIMFAASKKLDNLILIVDNNHMQSDGNSADIIDMDSLADKFIAFGFETFSVNGHSIPELYGTFEKIISSNINKPKVLIANTVKGKGFSFMENVPAYHHARLSEELYKQALEELK